VKYQRILKNDQQPQKGFKQMNEVGKSIQDLDEKVDDMVEKCPKEIEILKKIKWK
jgi:hypothetical protein